MFYRDRSEPAPPSFRPTFPRRPSEIVSALLVLAVIALCVARPDFLGDRPSLVERLAQALLFVGTIGNLLHAMGLKPARQLSRLAADPRLAWPAVVIGAAGLLWLG